ncbi:MAG: hypothetical protein A3K10_12505 [Bacteroidetes bacterium RIFCSPLOWO2_12_FULL_31_6]|nr:MAG: hypothetical protein A3K10_12505 [Bacteroidetes bacterium RIFCSPLOWO2_12_FULL_31_6]
MKTAFKLAVIFSIFSFLVVQSCKKDVRKGCTDPNSLNYNVLAEEDDGSCEYLDSTITIWSNGKSGYWGNELTGTFVVKSCFTGITTILLNPDSAITLADTTITPADTIIDNIPVPPDTTIIPADTTITAADTVITGDTYLLVNSDASGNYELILQLLNKRNAENFKNGYLIFNAKLHPAATINSFGVFIYGNHLNAGGANCGTFLQSDPINIVTSILDSTSFKEITIPLSSFTNRYMQDIDIVFGIKGTGATPNTPLIIISNIKWTTKIE